jgi:hypothetical protein
MKRQDPTIAKAPAIALDRHTSPTFLNICNSLETMRGYYLEKVQDLEFRLKDLNLMENAREITAICHEIIRAKKVLKKLNMRTGYLA